MTTHITPLTVLTASGAALGIIAFWITHGGDAARVRELNTCADLQNKIDALSQEDIEDSGGTRSLLREHLENELQRRLGQLDAHRQAQSRPAWQIALTRILGAVLSLWALILGLTAWFVMFPDGTIEVPGKPFSQTQASMFAVVVTLAVAPPVLWFMGAAGVRIWRRRSRYVAAIKQVARRPRRDREPAATPADTSGRIHAGGPPNGADRSLASLHVGSQHGAKSDPDAR